MKEVTVDGQEILLARDQGAYYAVSSKCTHFGASLVNGKWYGKACSLPNGRVGEVAVREPTCTSNGANKARCHFYSSPSLSPSSALKRAGYPFLVG